MKTKQLGDLVKITKGKKYDESHNTALRYIQIEDLRNNDNLKFCKPVIGQVLCYPQDILIAWDGANAGTIGYGLEGAIGSTIAKLQIIESEIDTKYLGKFLQSKFDYLRERCTGATIPHISKAVLCSLKIPLPPLPEQQRIAAILDAADALRKKTQQLIDSYDELAQSVFLDMFGDPVKNEKGWEKRKLGTITEISSGSTPSRRNDSYFEGNIPWIKTTELRGNQINDSLEKISKEALRNTSCRLYPAGTILIAMYGQGVTRGKVGVLGIEAATNQACAALPPSNRMDFNYLFYYLKFSYEDLRNLGRGGNQPNLNIGLVKAFEVLSPPLSLQTQFAQKIELIEKQKELAKQSLRESEDLFQSLLQKAFKGELGN